MKEEKLKRLIRILGFVILCFAYLIAYFHRTSTAIMAPNLMEEFNLTPEMVGIFSSMYFYPYMVMQIPSGMMSDRFGTYRISGLFMLISGGGTFLIAYGGSFYLAIIGRIFVGIGMACIFVPTLKLIATGFSEKYYLFLSSALLLCGNFGAIIGSGFLVTLLTKYGWRNSLGLIGTVTLTLGIILFLIGRGENKINKESSRPENKLSVIQGLKVTFPYPGMIPHYIASFFSYGCIMAFQGVWGGAYLMQVLKFSRETAGSILMMVGVGIVVVSPFTGWISNYIKSRKKLTVMGAVTISLSLAFLVFMPFKPTSFNLHIIALMIGLGIGINSPSKLTQIKETFSSEFTGIASGNNNLFTMAGGALIPTLLGYIISRFSEPGLISKNSLEIAFMLLFIMSIIPAIATMFTKETFGVNFKVSILNNGRKIA